VKKKPYFLIKLCFFSCLFGLYNLQAQETISASSSTASGSGGTISYSVGQTVYTTVNGSGGSLHQGVQQAYEINTLGEPQNKHIGLTVAVYPNPAVNDLHLKIENKDFENLSFSIYSINGELLLYKPIDRRLTIIPMHKLPVAIYFLKVTANQQTLETFKIIKN